VLSSPVAVALGASVRVMVVCSADELSSTVVATVVDSDVDTAEDSVVAAGPVVAGR